MSGIKAVVERLNSSGYEYEGAPVTARNVVAVIDVLLKQLDDAAAEVGSALRGRAEPVAYADPQAFRNFQAGMATKEWMWAQADAGLVPVFVEAPPAPGVADERYQQLSELYHDQEKRLFKLAQRIKGPTFDKYAHSPSQAIDELEAAIFGENDEESRAAMLAAPAKN
ncbi:hypothetical protein HUZ94_06685 [Cronobacter sakazakii]|uniref:hypothetical protein n=1 Tax=Cronobacter sakazakii TaxID=28141 RepID=UPI0015881000|nr:hypothetical protein [Cronobacter sakazakii]NUW63268.1 hypothetical protein [Cronobacter sakazakii]